MNLIQGKNRLKIKTEGGEKTDSSDEDFFIVKKKAVQETDSSDDYFEEKYWLLARMILKKINQLMETGMSTLKKL